MPKPTEESLMELESFLEKHHKRLGVKVLSILRDSVNTHFSPIEISLTIAQKGSLSPLLKNVSKADHPIAMTDKKTLKRIRIRARALIRSIKANTELGLDTTTLLAEFNALRDYIWTVTTPGGTIKSFNQPANKEYQRLRQAIKRILDIAKEESPLAYAEIKNCLATGYSWVWVDV